MILFGFLFTLFLVQAVACVLMACRSEFYRGYFRQKQRNAGKDPDEVIRRIFPRLWWFMR